MRYLLAACLFSLTSVISQAAAQIPALTLYNQNFGVLSQIKTLDISEGDNLFTFPALKACDPSLVIIEPLQPPNAFSVRSLVIQQPPQSRLWDNLLRQQVQVITTQGDRYSGQLLCVDPVIVLQTSAGEYFSLIKEHTAAVLSRTVPDTGIGKPVIQLRLQGHRQCSAVSRVLTGLNGLNWKAEYHIYFRDHQLRISPWASIQNETETQFESVTLALIAGIVKKRRSSPVPFKRTLDAVGSGIAYEASENVPNESKIFEFHRYEYPEPISLLPYTTQKIALYKGCVIPARKRYVYDPSVHSASVIVYHEFTNDQSDGFGKPLPAGSVQLFQEKGDITTYVGETTIGHTPENAVVELQTGTAFDITVKRTQVDQQRISNRVRRESYSVELLNGSGQTVTVYLRDHFSPEWRIDTSNLPPRKKDSRTVEFEVPVKAHDKTTVEYTVQIQW